MTILPKKKLSNKNDDGPHPESDRAHHSHSHAHGHRDRVDHGMAVVQRSEDGRLYVASQNSGPCWQPRDREEKRQGAHESEGDGPSHVKRRHRDVPRTRGLKSRLQSGTERQGTGSGPVPGVVPPGVASGCVSPSRLDDGSSSPIAGPSGFKPKPKSKSGLQVPRSRVKGSSPGPARREESESEQEAVNSDDEYEQMRDDELTEDDWREREEHFEKLLKKKNLVIKQMEQDGACLFRAVADQVYGDQEMHGVVRGHCMDYIAKNADFFSEYVTEDFESYVTRKRLDWVHGNNVEIQALSEMYNRPIEVYSYSAEPINTFHGEQQTDNPPIRLSYHRHVHYNSVVDPWAPTIGIGLGLPGYKPGTADKKLMHDALHQSENTALEQAMLEDKLKATDWEATDEAIEEQVARESYLQWLRDNEKRRETASTSSAQCQPQQPLSQYPCCKQQAGRSSAARSVGLSSPKPGTSTSRWSPDAPRYPAGPSSSTTSYSSSSSSSGSSSPGVAGATAAVPGASSSGGKLRKGSEKNFPLDEAASFLNNLPPEMFGLSDFEDNDSILARVLAASQEEYLNSLKKKKTNSTNVSASASPAPSHPPSPQARDEDRLHDPMDDGAVGGGDGEGDGAAASAAPPADLDESGGEVGACGGYADKDS